MATTRKRILVTGSSGLVGRQVCRHYLDSTDTLVVGLDCRPADRPLVHKRFRDIECDLSDAAAMKALPRQVDAVIHMAAAIDARNPVDLFAANVLGTVNLLAYARRAGARHVVFGSTGGVYGYGSRPHREDDPMRPFNDYTISKYAAERVVQRFAGDFGTTILRLFFPYGPGQKGRFIANLIERIGRGAAIDLHAGDRPRLNPVHVDDVARAVALAARRRGHHVLNIAGRRTVTVRRIAEMIAKRLGVTARFRRKSGTGTAGNMAGNISRAARVLSWRPEISLAKGLDGMIGDAR